MSELNIVVLVKQVPDIEKVRFDVETGRLDRSSAEGITNPFDLNALEVGVQIKEETEGKVTVMSMGPSLAESTLRDCLARGADRAILLRDNKFAGSDTLATSYTLANAMKKVGGYDLVVCGEKTLDGDTAQVGSEVAELLGLPSVAYVEEIQGATKTKLQVRSKIGKYYYVYEMNYPCLITVTKDVNTPRLPTLKDKIRSRRAQIEVWDANHLLDVADAEKFGLKGSPTWVMKIFTPLGTQKRKEIILEGDGNELAEKLFSILEENKVLR